MIKANELRIGNIINYQGVKKIVNSLSSTTVNVCYPANYGEFNYPNTPIEHIKPIPLTDELLLKCGFIKGYDDCYYFESHFVIYRRYRLFGLQGCGLSYREFKYVHELQNLYFALTGTELEIKL